MVQSLNNNSPYEFCKKSSEKNNTDYNRLVGKYTIKYYARINVLDHVHINKEFYFRW